MEYKVANTVLARPFVSPSAKRELLFLVPLTNLNKATVYLPTLIYLLPNVSALRLCRDIQTKELLLVTKWRDRKNGSVIR
jgi:hypothetical protein